MNKICKKPNNYLVAFFIVLLLLSSVLTISNSFGTNENKLDFPEKELDQTKYPLETNPAPLISEPRKFPKNHPMNDYSDVLVIVNNNSAISKQIGQYFKEQRNIPDKNICVINTTAAEVIDNTTFHSFRKQIEDYLENNNLTMNINYLVTTKGVPLRITSNDWHRRASVDSELTLILGKFKQYIDDPNNFQIANNYYQKNYWFSRTYYSIYLVSRLTGYDFEDVKQLIDNAAASAGKHNNGGTFLFDRDPVKSQSGTWRPGNTRMDSADNILRSKGYTSTLDFSAAFLTNRNNLAGYCSWGGYDAEYLSTPMTNTRFETDTTPADGIPDGWFYEIFNSSDNISLNNTVHNSGSWSVNITRNDYNATSYTAVSQNVTINPNYRYFLVGSVSREGISSGGGVHLQIRAYNSSNQMVWILNSTPIYGTYSNFVSLNKLYYDPIPGVSKLTISAVLSRSSGTGFVDDIALYEVRPRHTYVSGALAEVYGRYTARTFDYYNINDRYLANFNVGDMISDGITGIKGYVDYIGDPYIDTNARVYTLFDAYTAGYNLAENFYMASPYVSWVDVVIGDPKCSPYFDLLPDLTMTVENLTFSKEFPNQGDSVNINALIENPGGSNIYNFNVTFWIGKDFDNSNKLGTKTVPFIGAKNNIKIDITWDTSKYKGFQTIWVELDSDYAVREQVEDNNVISKDITINSYPYDTELKVSKNTLYRGESLALFMNLTDNETSEEQLLVTVSLKNNKDSVWQELSNPIFVNDHWQVGFTTNKSSILGWYDIRVSAIDDNQANQIYTKNKVFEILNNLPMLSNFQVNKYSLNRSESMTIGFDAFDFEDKILGDMFEIQIKSEKSDWVDLDATLKFELDQSQWQFDYFSNITNVLGSYDFKITLTDKDGGIDVLEELNVFKILNNPPTLQRVVLDKPSIYRGNFATLYIFGTDLETAPDKMTIFFQQRLDQENLTWLNESFGSSKWNPIMNRWELIFFTNEKTPLGNHSFRVQLTDSDSAKTEFVYSDTTLDVLNNPPTPEITVDASEVNEDEIINFAASNSKDYEDVTPNKYQWLFGDGTQSDLVKTAHSFTKSGTYNVTLLVTDKDFAIASTEFKVTIKNVAPVAEIKIISSSAEIKVGQIIEFDGRDSYDTVSDKLNLSYHWEFDDGNTSNLPYLEYSYKRSGTYIISLTVTDDDGLQSKKIRDLTINPAEMVDNDGDGNDETSWFETFGLIIILIIIVLIIIILLGVWSIFSRRRKKEMAPGQKPVPRIEADVVNVPKFDKSVTATGLTAGSMKGVKAKGMKKEPGKPFETLDAELVTSEKHRTRVKPDVSAMKKPQTSTFDYGEGDQVSEVEIEFAPDMKKSKAVPATPMVDGIPISTETSEAETETDLQIHLPDEFDKDVDEGEFEFEELDSEVTELPEPGSKPVEDIDFIPPKIDLTGIISPEVQPAMIHKDEIDAAKERGEGFEFAFRKPKREPKRKLRGSN